MGEDCVVFHHDGDTPQTHVLIVGVGHYPYFRGGGDEADAEANLGQLTSPPPSVRALANWFIDEYHYPTAPLGSVALLTSDAGNKTFETPSGNLSLRKPTYEAFAKAVQHWYNQGNISENNRLIFVFCGHGFGYGSETSLLMSDFDFRRLDRWESAIDLGTFHAGMDTCAAAEQIYFIDACRRPHGDLLPPKAAIGRSPIHPKADPRSGYSTTRNAPLIFSTGDDEPARGREDGASVFTEAFLRAVRGMGARDDTDDWRVNYYSLLEAMSHVSWRLTEKEFPQPQQPQGSEARQFCLHVLRSKPMSPIYLERDNNEACGPGQILYNVSGQPVTRSCNQDDYEIELDLPFGQYQFALHHSGREVATGAGHAKPTFRRARLVKCP